MTENSVFRFIIAFLIIGFYLKANAQFSNSDTSNVEALESQTAEPKKNTSIDSTETESKDVISTNEDPAPFIKSKKERFDGQDIGTRYIEHPNAKKGLIRIDKEKAYYYKVKTSEQSKATTVHFATYEPTDLVNPDNADLRYDSIYDSESWPLITYESEKQFAQGFGKLGWKWGTGFYLAKGNGQFETPQAEEPLEEFTLIVFPINLGLIYRAQYWDSQFAVPYAEASVGGFCFAEIRDDDQNPSLGAAFGFAPMAQVSGGLSFQLGSGSSSFLDLDREYGINRMFIDVEYRAYLALGNYDFSANVIALGLTAEY
jgi:hypothetical protein